MRSPVKAFPRNLRSGLEWNAIAKDTRVWTENSDGTLTPELMAVNPESIPSRAKVETITHSLSA